MQQPSIPTRAAKRRSLRRLLPLSAVAVGMLALLPVSASAWTSNYFSSPTRNIRCHNGGSWIACTTLNSGLVVTVTLYGHAYTDYDQSEFGVGGPTLYYGQSYNVTGRFHCLSRSDGMTCSSVRSGHGFFINRTNYRVW